MSLLPQAWRAHRRTVLALALAAKAALLIVVVASTVTAPGAQADNGTAGITFERANAHFQQATAGNNTGAVDAAATEFKALSDAAPTDPVLRAYVGAATAMRATTTLLPWKKMGYVEDGLAQIDKALAQLTPEHDAPTHQRVSATLQTRFTAASTFLALPSMFNRGPRGEQLLAEVLKSPLLAATPLPFRGAVWLLAGKQAAKAGRQAEARQWLDQVITANAPQAAAAQTLRQGL